MKKLLPVLTLLLLQPFLPAWGNVIWSGDDLDSPQRRQTRLTRPLVYYVAPVPKRAIKPAPLPVVRLRPPTRPLIHRPIIVDDARRPASSGRK